ncbi:putative nuclease HARBI1 isoform X1 [Helicoverpa zea]|uniref:putative nuclease HARBI1 isoform X1 n=1 Tax=Helicoverpa zea TaxID=7113 RepID=UPI001F5A9330|nr:putative nuclease HARBI1 isoform X1 [Helicoverpa zea]
MDSSSSDSDDSDLQVLAQLSDWDDDEGDCGEIAFVELSKSFLRTDFMASLSDAEFTFRFRMNKESVESLLNEIMPFVKVKSRRNNGIPPLHQLLLALRFYALGAMLKSVAEFVGVSQSSACRIVADISTVLARLYSKYINLHARTTLDFYNIAQFPRVCGVIGCTHVPIQCPSSTMGEEYRNGKGYYSFHVQAVCDADLKLLNVVSQWPGSAHQSTIFDNSVLRGILKKMIYYHKIVTDKLNLLLYFIPAQCDDGVLGNCWLLGDNAYPNRPYLLTPVYNPSTAQEVRYNEAHIQTRRAIGRAFAVWKRRFPVISLTMRLSLDNIQAVIIATAVLYNICINHNIEDVPPEVELPDENEIAATAENVQSSENDLRNRQHLIANFF